MKLFYASFVIFSFDIIMVPLRSAAGPFTIITYPDLPSDYLDFKFEFDRDSSVDPFFKKSHSSMVEDCENLRNAALYRVCTGGGCKKYSTEARLTSSDLKRESKGLKYETTEVRISESGDNARDELPARSDDDGDKHRVNLFRCATAQPDKYLYLSYGFHDELAFMYLFEDIRDDETAESELKQNAEIKFVARVERKPKMYGDFQKVRDVKRIFLNVINNFKDLPLPLPVPVDEDTLCTLNANQQFRLCSLIDSVRRPESVLKDNFLSENYHRCMGWKLINLREDRNGKPPLYRIERIYVNVVPCFNEESALFYLTADPSDRTAVFTLVRAYKSKADANGSNGSTSGVKDFDYLVPDGFYQNVSVLKYRTEVY